MSKWWKCDLQVATPAWRFTMPPDVPVAIGTEDERQEFADRYMAALKSKGIDVIALADHNTGSWVDTMVAAGKRAGVTVFPGVEVTTGSGADGIHIIIIGASTKTSQDFDRLLAGALGFDEETHPRYHEQGDKQVPGSSGKTLLQILDDLPDDYLAIAPHALNQNGIASGSTVKGDLRWKALHHPKLVAVDPGDCSKPDGDSFDAQFRRRALHHFPRIADLAFVSTSDAYGFQDFGTRFAWIRMEEPSLEALRQAFLDHEARIICDWDARLQEYPERNPNRVRHAWLARVRLESILSNSTASLEVEFHPALNVIIGGRGSGKSTVVAALRQLYAGFSTLPATVRQEAEQFAVTAFSGAVLSATHFIANSQELQTVSWKGGNGFEGRGILDNGVPANFRVRVVNQKELFARVAYDPHDPLSASRSFLAFVDEGLGLLSDQKSLPGDWRRRLEQVGVDWTNAARAFHSLRRDLAQLPSVRNSVAERERQVSAFDSDAARDRRIANEQRFAERDELSASERAVRALVEAVEASTVRDGSDGLATEVVLGADAQEQLAVLQRVAAAFKTEVLRAVERARASLESWRVEVDRSAWGAAVRAAEVDDRAYIEELRALGVDPTAYVDLKQQLSKEATLLRALEAEQAELQSAADLLELRWREVLAVIEDRRSRRLQLMQDVGGRSARLKFNLVPYGDVTGWVAVVRELLNIRADGFLEDVPETAQWVWGVADEATRELRWRLWRDALTSGDFAAFGSKENAGLRPTWQRRLETLDQSLRLRLATEIPDDAVEMQFLRDGGQAEVPGDWQDITRGSPGQRTAAMLAFVLHHGTEPLILDQPEDDLDTEWLSQLVVKELRASRWKRQLIVVTHNANIPVNGDAERVSVLENRSGVLRVRKTKRDSDGSDVLHCGAIEVAEVRDDIQNIMEGGVRAFMLREQKYNNELSIARWNS